MKLKTQNLTGPALDWAAAKCDGYPSGCGGAIPYSTSWKEGGPIIERKKIRIEPFAGSWLACIWDGDAYTGEYRLFYRGPTPLIAAMRCFVASCLGDEVEIPEELV